ncbi:MAG: xanthine dehydrogenase small subunit [Bacteroidales bacterium]|nr:xanthine dehydrogenase small subunit [Bacteroidales bacterium]
MKSNTIQFILDNEIYTIDWSKVDFLPSTTVLQFLRAIPGHTGTKEGCAEGDCGACTIVLAELTQDNKLTYKAIDSCLLFLPALHGKQLITIENLATKTPTATLLHPVQQAIVETNASQCGYCTPGIAMSVFGMYKTLKIPDTKNIIDSLSGNLCRCTGYGSIIEAAKMACNTIKPDHFSGIEPTIIETLKEINRSTDAIELSHKHQLYLLPKTLKQALELRGKYPQATIVNGSTDIAVRQNKTSEFHHQILDISSVTEIKQIITTNNYFQIGAGCSIEDFKKFVQQNFHEFSPITDHFASLQIRNVATVGGNICNASPIGDLIPMLIVLKAQVKTASTVNSRMINIEDFITGYRSIDLHNKELVTDIIIPKRDNDSYYFSEKVSTRRDLDISTLSIATIIKLSKEGTVDDIILVYGGLAATVKRAKSCETFLLGKQFTLSTISETINLITNDFTPISDARSTTEYRLETAGNLLLKCYYSVLNELESK